MGTVDMSRTIFIGDVHGCFVEFQELLGKLGVSKGSDRVVLLGDLMDRGPDPISVIRLARDFGFECVMGNHDEKHIRWARHEEKKRLNPNYKNPMRTLPEKDQKDSLLLREEGHLEWLKALPSTIAIEKWNAVHAGFEPQFSMFQQREEKLLRIRYVDPNGKMVPISSDTDQPPGTVRWATAWKEPLHAVYGHHARDYETPMIDVYEDESGARWMRYGIDTACCFGGYLTAMVVKDLSKAEEVEFVSVKSRGKYAELWKKGED